MMIRADFVYNRDTHKGIHPWLDERKGGGYRLLLFGTETGKNPVN